VDRPSSNVGELDDDLLNLIVRALVHDQDFIRQRLATGQGLEQRPDEPGPPYGWHNNRDGHDLAQR
jgi:hypothetical protein